MKNEKIYRWFFVVGFALLAISFLGWEKPLDFPAKMPLIFRIIGIGGALTILLAVFVGLRGRDLLEQFVFLETGIFAIGILGWFCLGFTEERKEIFWVVGCAQTVWILSVLYSNITSETIQERRTIRKRIDTELKKIFPTIDLYLARFSAFACGLCSVGFITSLTWIILTLNPETYFTETRPLVRIMLKWVAALLACVPVAVLTGSTKKTFVKTPNPSKSKLKEITLHAGMLGVGFALFVACTINTWVLCGSICVLWVIVCRFWYKHALTIASKAEHSDYHLEIKKIAGEQTDAAFDAVGSEAFRPEAVPTEEGMQISNVEGQLTVPWEEIRNVFIMQKPRRLMVVRHDESTVLGILTASDSRKHSQNTIDHLWQCWFDKIDGKDQLREFEYPQWCRQIDARKVRNEGLELAAIGVLLIVITCLLWAFSGTETSEDLYIALFFLAVGSGALLGGLWFSRTSKKKRLSRISVSDEQLTITFDDGSTGSYRAINDVTKHKLGLGYDEGSKLVFKDGTILRHLERMDYWPVLRQWLKIKLESKTE